MEESEYIPTDESITCCDCQKSDYFDHTGDSSYSLCRHCGHTVCMECKKGFEFGGFGGRIEIPVLMGQESKVYEEGPMVFAHGRSEPSITNRILESRNEPVIVDTSKEERAEKLDPQGNEHLGAHMNSLPSPFEEDSESSDASSCNDSIFSGPASIASTQESLMDPIIVPLAIEEFTHLLCQDEAMMADISKAVSTKYIEFDRTRNRFRKLLKRHALDLKAEARNDSHQAFIRLVSSLSSSITRELFSKFGMDNQFQIPSFLQNIPDRRQKVNDYIRKQYNHVEPVESQDDSDQDSLDEEADEELYDESLPPLDQLSHFITSSIAYETLRRRFHEFVYPSLRSKLRNLLELWSRHDNKYHAYVLRYGLPNLAAELQHINPHEIKFPPADERVDYMTRLTGNCQDTIERWTGERWDWSPLPRCARSLKAGESRIRWECNCGEMRQAEVPLAFIKRLQSIIHSLPHSPQPPTASFPGGSSGLASTSNNGSHTKPPQKIQGNQQPASSPSSNPLQSGPWPQAVISGPNTLSQRILFIAERGMEYKMAQIGVDGIFGGEFFSMLKNDYFRLRGFIRTWFSIWRYSHCDFYKCEKFDDHQFVPRQKNVFPEVTNADYEYQPRPMDFIPPISEHEFTRRFYACNKGRLPFHWHHTCGASKGDSNAILSFFPKKKTEFIETGSDREYFWGIYAREMISLRWVLAYNVGCALPMLVVFAVRILPAGYATNLQDPSVPFTMMIGMLSLFWAIFLSSLQFGRSTG
ncbi:uncharacterized protein GGS22DRAFT_151294 [Annulohypoxylon maeteangense]|uniref:uncharacterized protein n=1 Tax=Annulohypoxylon maeteangense TaxID=1927788 RepID=UPI0020080FC1|nr:uncharacterized protein GGS22DRAFT_151294 [Annulohypoxylon maeteangense]KAI0890580.1 hypothetical protein GGS22DRAFT_151294 [Annulohypoxylon maeteangense]